MSIVRNFLVGAGVGIAALALSPVQASAGMIVNSFCQFENSTDEAFRDAYFDLHYFTASAGDPVRAVMMSTELDVLIRLVDANTGQTLAENDDRGDGTTNAELFTTIAEDGEYEIVATTRTYLGEGPFYIVAATGEDASEETFYDQMRYAGQCVK